MKRRRTGGGWADTVSPQWEDTAVLDEAADPAPAKARAPAVPMPMTMTAAPEWADTCVPDADDEAAASERHAATALTSDWHDTSPDRLRVAQRAAAAVASAAPPAAPSTRGGGTSPAAPAARNAPGAPLAPTAPAPGRATANGLRVSVVIPTYHRPRLLLQCLSALARQTLRTAAFEIIVVDDGHSSRTRVAVQDFMQSHPALAVRYLRPAQGRGPAVARNAGWRAAHAPLVAFTDDDTEPLTDWLEAGVRALADARFVAVAGRVLVPPTGAPGAPAMPPTDHERMTRGLETAEFVTANAFVRKRALEAVQGFDERFARAWREDSDLQFRLLQHGGADDVIGRAPRAMVLHPVRAERWGVSLRQQKNAFYDALLYRQHPQLYRERIHPRPPWNYFAIVLATLALPVCLLAGWRWAASICAALVVGLVLAFARRRLDGTAHAPAHVWEMLATSALIPYLSVYWRLRGAWHFRVAFL